MTPMPSNLLARLRSNMEPLSPKLRTIAQHILDHPAEVQFQTITDLARSTATSEATVVRLCRDMGFRGYSDFRMALAIDLSQSSPSAPTNDNDSPINAAVQQATTALQDTAKLLDKNELEQICDQVHQASHIHCVGVGASGIVAEYLAYRLLRIGKNATMYDDTHLAVMKAVRSEQSDLWFAVSSSGSTTEVLQTVKQARQKGCPVALLSNIRHSPMASEATNLLVGARPEGPLTGGAFASKVSALLLVDVIINHLVSQYPKYQDAIKQTAEATAQFSL